MASFCLQQIRRMLFALPLLICACSSDEAPSQAAIKAGQAAIDAGRDEASKFIPEELQKLDNALKSAQDKFQKKDFAAALNESRDLAAKAQDMAKTASARKEELTRAWEDINLGLPGEMERLQAFLENLGDKIPKDVSAAQLAQMKQTFAGLGAQLQEARQAAQSGELVKAVNLGSAVRAKTVEISQVLGAVEAQ